MTPDEYCKDRASKSGSSFYYSFLFLPAEKRRAIIALYAFCREVDDVVDECSDPGLARIKLQWWRMEVERIFSGIPEHPVGKSIKAVLEHFDLQQAHFEEIIDGMEMDLDQSRYNDFKELNLYCYRVASVVGLMAAEIFGYQNRQTLKYAHNLGMAFQLTNILRDVREDIALGRIYIPQDELKKFNVTESQLHQSQTSDKTIALFKFQADRAHEYYRKAFELLPDEDRHNQKSGLAMAAIYQATLREIEKDGFQILKQRISLTPLRKLWLAWKTVMSENRRHKKYLKNK